MLWSRKRLSGAQGEHQMGVCCSRCSRVHHRSHNARQERPDGLLVDPLEQDMYIEGRRGMCSQHTATTDATWSGKTNRSNSLSGHRGQDTPTSLLGVHGTWQAALRVRWYATREVGKGPLRPRIPFDTPRPYVVPGSKSIWRVSALQGPSPGAATKYGETCL